MPRSKADAPTFTLSPELRRTSTIVVLGSIMSILDTTIVAVALPDLARDFHVSVTTIQWVSTGYLLALAMVTPVSGWAVDRFGAKRVWMLSTALFVIGSSLCGLAWSANSLIFFRVLQGFGGGMLLPVGQSILARAAGPQRMGPRHEHHRRADGDGPDHGARHRRPHHLQLQLALDLLHQGPHRHHHADPLRALAAQIRHRRSVHRAVRHPWVLSPVSGPRAPAVLALRGRDDRLPHQHLGVGELRPRRPADGRLHPARHQRKAYAAGPAPVQEPQLHDRQHLYLRHRRDPVRLDVPVADLLPGRPRPGSLASRLADGAPGHRRRLHHAVGRRGHRPGWATPGGALRHPSNGGRDPAARLRHLFDQRAPPRRHVVRARLGSGPDDDAGDCGRLLRPQSRRDPQGVDRDEHRANHGGSVATALFAVVLERQIVSNLTAAGIKAPGGSAGIIGATGKLPPAVADPVAAAFAHTFWWSFFAILLAFVPTLFLPNHAPIPTEKASEGETDGTDPGPRVAGAMLD